MRVFNRLTGGTLLAAAAAFALAPAAAQDRMIIGSPPAAGKPGGGHGGSIHGGGWHRPGHGQGRGQHHRYRRWQNDRDDISYWVGGGGAYDDVPIAGEEGFFGDGEAVSLGNRVHYDYDRGYPYRHFRDRRSRLAVRSSETGPYRCEVDWVPAGRGRGETPVRICRR